MAVLKIILLFLIFKNQPKVFCQSSEEYYDYSEENSTENSLTNFSSNDLTHVRTKNLSGNVKLTTLQVLPTDIPYDNSNKLRLKNVVGTILENQQNVLLSEVRTKVPTDGMVSYSLMDVFTSTSGTLPHISTEKPITVVKSEEISNFIKNYKEIQSGASLTTPDSHQFLQTEIEMTTDKIVRNVSSEIETSLNLVSDEIDDVSEKDKVDDGFTTVSIKTDFIHLKKINTQLDEDLSNETNLLSFDQSREYIEDVSSFIDIDEEFLNSTTDKNLDDSEKEIEDVLEIFEKYQELENNTSFEIIAEVTTTKDINLLSENFSGTNEKNILESTAVSNSDNLESTFATTKNYGITLEAGKSDETITASTANSEDFQASTATYSSNFFDEVTSTAATELFEDDYYKELLFESTIGKTEITTEDKIFTTADPNLQETNLGTIDVIKTKENSEINTNIENVKFSLETTKKLKTDFIQVSTEILDLNLASQETTSESNLRTTDFFVGARNENFEAETDRSERIELGVDEKLRSDFIQFSTEDLDLFRSSQEIMSKPNLKTTNFIAEENPETERDTQRIEFFTETTNSDDKLAVTFTQLPSENSEIISSFHETTSEANLRTTNFIDITNTEENPETKIRTQRIEFVTETTNSDNKLAENFTQLPTENSEINSLSQETTSEANLKTTNFINVTNTEENPETEIRPQRTEFLTETTNSDDKLAATFTQLPSENSDINSSSHETTSEANLKTTNLIAVTKTEKNPETEINTQRTKFLTETTNSDDKLAATFTQLPSKNSDINSSSHETTSEANLRTTNLIAVTKTEENSETEINTQKTKFLTETTNSDDKLAATFTQLPSKNSDINSSSHETTSEANLRTTNLIAVTKTEENSETEINTQRTEFLTEITNSDDKLAVTFTQLPTESSEINSSFHESTSKANLRTTNFINVTKTEEYLETEINTQRTEFLTETTNSDNKLAVTFTHLPTEKSEINSSFHESTSEPNLTTKNLIADTKTEENLETEINTQKIEFLTETTNSAKKIDASFTQFQTESSDINLLSHETTSKPNLKTPNFIGGTKTEEISETETNTQHMEIYTETANLGNKLQKFLTNFFDSFINSTTKEKPTILNNDNLNKKSTFHHKLTEVTPTTSYQFEKSTNFYETTKTKTDLKKENINKNIKLEQTDSWEKNPTTVKSDITKPNLKQNQTKENEFNLNSLQMKFNAEKPQISARINNKLIELTVIINFNESSFFIPSYAYLIYKNPIINITWYSSNPKLNNSLEINLEKFTQLNIVKNNEMNIFKRSFTPETQTDFIEKNVITLNDNIQIYFSQVEFFKLNSTDKTTGLLQTEVAIEITGICLGITVITGVLVYLAIRKFKEKTHNFKPNPEV